MTGIDEPYLAWCFDEAVSTFGRWVEAKLDEQDPILRNGQVAGYRPRWRITELLGIETPQKASVQALKAIFGSELEVLP
jgi:hypothetical protein